MADTTPEQVRDEHFEQSSAARRRYDTDPYYRQQLDLTLQVLETTRSIMRAEGVDQETVDRVVRTVMLGSAVVGPWEERERMQEAFRARLETFMLPKIRIPDDPPAEIPSVSPPVHVNPRLLKRYASAGHLHLVGAMGELPAQHHIQDPHAPQRSVDADLVRMMCARSWLRHRTEQVGEVSSKGMMVCPECVDAAEVFPDFRGQDHPLRRPEIDDEPIQMPTRLLVGQIPDNGLVWLTGRSGVRVLHVVASWTVKSDPGAPLDCGMDIAWHDSRFTEVGSADLDRPQTVLVCRRCAQLHFG